MTDQSNYTIEIVTPQGELVADVSGIATGRGFSVRRNRAEQIQLAFNLHAVDDLCQRLGLTFTQLFAVGRNEVRIKRGNRYLLGGQINYVLPTLDGEGARVQVQAMGFLHLLKDRYLWPSMNRTYTLDDIGFVMWDLINTVQTNGPGADLGIYQGEFPLGARLLTETWEPLATSLRDILIALSERQNSVDFSFSYDKAFNVHYPSQGTVKTDLRFSYPGNIKAITLPIDYTEPANYVWARGTGNGAAQVRVNQHYPQAVNTFARRERIEDFPSVSREDTLTEKANESLRLWGQPVVIPEITLDGTMEPFLGAYWIGDWVKFDVEPLGPFGVLDGQEVRINQIGVSIDDMDNEEIKLLVGHS